MADPSDGSSGSLPMLGTQDPAQYKRQAAKERFAVSKFYGMGSDGEWTIPRIAEALDCSPRQVSRYIHKSSIGEEVREVLATTEAEWRLDMALQLRREVEDINETLRELKQRKKAVATDYETKTVTGTPTGDRNVSLAEDAPEYRLKMPVPTDFETVTDYGPDIEKLQKEKRQYLAQIADLLGLNDSDEQAVDQTLASRADEVKIVEVRQTDDPYPTAEPIDMDEADPEEAADAGSDVIEADFEEVEEDTDESTA